MSQIQHPVLLIVLDGWGHTDEVEHNAIANAATPVWDSLWAQSPRMLIHCSGTEVGLPDQQMGNSEVGHMHIGAGRLIDQDFTRIGNAIKSGDFARNPVLREACARAAATDKAVHIFGLASPGGVHNHEDHLLALIDLAHAAGAPRIFVHAFLDGRDTPPQSAAASLQALHERCQRYANARIASIIGRYFAMDRNQHWDRVGTAYALIAHGQAQYQASDALQALDLAYARGETDEFIQATVVRARGEDVHCVADGDVILFANFRADRARELTSAFTSPDFAHFDCGQRAQLGAFVTMTDYGAQFDLPIAFASGDLRNTFGAVISGLGLKQLRIAETEKYAHVTFFFNGGEERVFEGEDRTLVPSPNVATYDLAPEMSAAIVTDKLVEALASGCYDAIICNYANADMVGHTGNFSATVRAIEALDTCLGRVAAAAKLHGVEVLITSDHGNAEKMRVAATAGSPSNPHTAHTSNLVPLIYVGRPARFAARGSLADIAPTMLHLMGLEIPPEMTGRPLLSLGDATQYAA